jgi:hypothetical protein
VPNGCGEEFDDVNGQECVADCHQDSDRYVKRDNNEFSKPFVSIVRVKEVKKDMNQSRQYDESLDDKNSSKIQAGDHGAEIRKNFNDTCQCNVESNGLVLVELAMS